MKPPQRRPQRDLVRTLLSSPNRPPAFMRSSRRGGWASPRTRNRRLPPLAVIVFNRLTFGPGPGDLDAFQAGGADDDARLEAFCESQLFPDEIDDSGLQARLAASGFSTLDTPQLELWQQHVLARPDYQTRMLSVREMERAVFIRAVHSRCQLREVLAEFWHDHFNVHAWDYDVGPNFSAYDRDAIRAHIFGNFRQMLGAVAASSNMLFYLDNDRSSNAGPNENYARELFELHTLGAGHYLGVGRQSDVPRDEQDRPLGYVDDDVYEATRCLTGWTVNEATGERWHRNDWHDRFQKTVLGRWFPADQPPFRDGEELLDLLAAHPGTARHVAGKLCRAFISDEPPATVVTEASRVFTESLDAPDQLRRVVRTIILSDAFRQTWGRKVKRPFGVAAAFLRATGADLVWPVEDGFSQSFLYQFAATGHAPFRWEAPDGYPDYRQAWLGSSTFVGLWRLLTWLVDRQDDSGHVLPVLAETPGELTTPEELADYWIDRMLGRPLLREDRDELVRFLAQGRNPAYPIDLVEEEVADRLRSLVALIGMSPEFLEK